MHKLLLAGAAAYATLALPTAIHAQQRADSPAPPTPAQTSSANPAQSSAGAARTGTSPTAGGVTTSATVSSSTRIDGSGSQQTSGSVNAQANAQASAQTNAQASRYGAPTVPVASRPADYPVCTAERQDSCINPWAAGRRGPGVTRPLSYWPGEPASSR